MRKTKTTSKYEFSISIGKKKVFITSIYIKDYKTKKSDWTVSIKTGKKV